ncbi:MAG TPA: serine/threonine-protein kinase [Mycobacterium sp.]|nr:serine/threonine-protein kinase [Mycobacterium sp.]
MSDDAHDVRAGSQLGPYLIKRLLGSGGMGQVFEAENTTMQRIVALKLISERYSQDPSFRKRLQREARIAGRLQEPHVVPVHDAGEIDGHLYVDMRLIDGTDLQTVLKNSGPLKPARAVAVVRQIAAALDAAHTAGVVHRDVKPANILLTGDDFAYLVDFGIASAAAEDQLTELGDVLGTWAYMAPERFAGQADKVTHSADTYALACVLYELLTGSPPYQGDRMTVMGAHLNNPAPQPSSRRSEIPEALDPVIARGMAKDPANRYASAGQFARAAAAAVGVASSDIPAQSDESDDAGDTVLPSKQPGPHEKRRGVRQFASAVRRRWIPIGIAASVFVAAVTGVGIWALTGRGPASQPAAPASPAPDSLTAADVVLLKVMPTLGYNRTNCTQQNPTLAADAVLACDKNPAVGAPSGRFFHFPNVDVLTDAYKSITAIFHATNCPGDPPGPDGPWSVNHKELGRQACYADNSLTPAAPSTIIANRDPAVMEIFNWTDSGGLDALAYWWRQGGASVQVAPGIDPDFFTQRDFDLLNSLNGGEYSKANCRHLDPPSPARAVLGCAHNLIAGAPDATFIAYPDRQAALGWYDSTVKVVGSHRCGESVAGPDDAWLHQGKPVGRYTCFADPSNNNRPALIAIDTEGTFTGAQFLADGPDIPFHLPKSERELAAWFSTRFIS